MKIKELNNFNQQGQLMIIILLVMVVTLTIGLTIASRQITNIRLTGQAELSQKAFSAAEAGIEDALRRDLQELTSGGAAVIPGIVGNANYQVTVERTGGGGSTEFLSEKIVFVNDVAQVVTNVVPPAPTLDGQTLTIYWAQTGSSPKASVEIVEVYQNPVNNWNLVRYTYNPSSDADPLSASNNFTTASGCVGLGCTLGSVTFTESLDITLNSATELVRIRPVYRDSRIGVRSNSGPFPDQSYVISSTGSLEGVSRKIEVTRSFNVTPAIIDFLIYSGSEAFPLAK